ncbi:MAG: hypothetical protein ABII88_04925 [Candidatus Omnitrophota bacterium]
MSKKNGFTLVEVQVSALLMVVVLLATGVIFYFALATMRYIQDAYQVYMNAHTAMKVITREVMISNRYGWIDTPTWVIAPPNGTPYGVGGDDQGCLGFLVPSLTRGGIDPLVDGSPAIYLRQEITANAGALLSEYNDDAMTCISLDAGTNTIWLDTTQASGGGGGAGEGAGVVIANNVTLLEFRKIAFNCVAVRLRVEGTAASPLPAGGDTQYNTLELNTIVTLRCAAARTCEPWGTGNVNDNIW